MFLLTQVQVTEWEEEIACLRQQLEDQERTMEARMKRCAALRTQAQCRVAAMRALVSSAST